MGLINCWYPNLVKCNLLWKKHCGKWSTWRLYSRTPKACSIKKKKYLKQAPLSSCPSSYVFSHLKHFFDIKRVNALKRLKTSNYQFKLHLTTSPLHSVFLLHAPVPISFPLCVCMCRYNCSEFPDCFCFSHRTPASMQMCGIYLIKS